MDQNHPLVVRILEELENHGFAVFEHHESRDNGYVIVSEQMIILVTKARIDVAFHIAMRPDDSASIILLLSRIKGVKRVGVMEVFTINLEGNILDGQKAIDYVETMKKRKIIEDYVWEQQCNYALLYGEAYHC